MQNVSNRDPAPRPPPPLLPPIETPTKVVYHRLTPEDAYTPYDPTRLGAVTEAVFTRGLSDAFRMPFSEAQLNSLARRYRCGDNQASESYHTTTRK